MKKDFMAQQVADALVEWIREYFVENGQGCKAVIGISGGKDSSVSAAACVKALGKDRVVGVLMPSGVQEDIEYSHALCAFLGISSVVVNIKETQNSLMALMEDAARQLNIGEIDSAVKINTPARIRMTTLYGIAGMLRGRVVNNCNLSEDWVGYSTKFGDAAGDFSPLCKLTVTEVKAIGKILGLPDKFIEKPPIDGLCGKTDEENLGFRYEVLDRYIREGVCEDAAIKQKIDGLQARNVHKLLPMPYFNYAPKN